MRFGPRRRRLVETIALPLVALLLPALAGANELVSFAKDRLGEEFLLQTSYERPDGYYDFMTSRSRLVKFLRRGDALRMVERRRHAIHPYRLLATIPIRDETADALAIDLNAGFNEVFEQEDRTGEDYYGHLDRDYYSTIRLTSRELLGVSRHGAVLVVEQGGRDELGKRVVVHYYLSPYKPNPEFEPFEVEGLDHFGFYETYPRRDSGRPILYAMKFDIHDPIVLALSARIPAEYAEAVRDGVRYWNAALGVEVLRAVDAPEGITAPDPDYNVIEWLPDRNPASTSHIQSDPLTGEILHASVFVRSGAVRDGEPRRQRDHLRYVVAHEVGHALGLRHNFAPGPASTVMNYFGFEQAVRIGNDVIEPGAEALEYDRKVVRYVYLGEPVDVDALPPFCTDDQAQCSPFPTLSGRGSAR